MKKIFLLASISALFLFTQAGVAAPEGDGFKNLFNGTDLTGWDGSKELWSVKDGMITGQTTPEHPAHGNTFLIWTNGTVADFELRFSYKIVPNNDEGFGNSGVQYRSKILKPDYWVVGGYQADFEAGQTYSGILYEEKMRGILAQRGQKTVIKEVDGKTKVEVVGAVGDSKEIQAAIKKEDWNDYVVIARGNHLQHFINGKQTVDVTDEQEAKAAKSGVLALQIHQGKPMTVQFKDIRIKEFPVEKAAGEKKIVFVAGMPSHGAAQHEHNAGCLLLQKCLEGIPGIKTDVLLNGWPEDPKFFDGADAVILYMDGGVGHPILHDDHLQQIGALMQKGVGLGCIHYAVEPTIEAGQKEFLDWIGGAFEVFWSVNPHWDGDFKSLPEHPVTRGVQPFKINDEWYYHMRFRDGMKGVTPILTSIPPEKTVGEDGHHSGNVAVREAVKNHEPQHVMWVAERDGGGRGFGFTGGHFHRNWGNENFRKVALNAILWIAKADVPQNGVESKITPEDLEKNLDPKGKQKK